MEMRKIVTELLAGTGKPLRSLGDSGWLEDVSPKRLRELYEQYSERFRSARAEVEAVLGDPTFQWPGDEGWFAEWYPEAIEAAAWRRDGRTVCLAVEHHDTELPVALVLRGVTDAELEALRS